MCATFFVTTAYMGGGMMWNDRIVESVRNLPDEQTELDLTAYGIGSYTLRESRTTVVDQILNDLKYLDFDEREAKSSRIYEDLKGSNRNNLMMNENEIAELSRSGMEIGGHTHRHPILSQMNSNDAYEEISTNKTMLEDIVKKPISSFAYPNGRPQLDYGTEHGRMLKEIGYEFAVSTSAGAASPSVDPFQIPRFSPWDKSQLRYNLRMIQNYFRNPQTA